MSEPSDPRTGITGDHARVPDPSATPPVSDGTPAGTGPSQRNTTGTPEPEAAVPPVQYYLPPGMPIPPGMPTPDQPGLATPQQPGPQVFGPPQFVPPAKRSGLGAGAIIAIVLGAVAVLIIGTVGWTWASLASATAKWKAKEQHVTAEQRREAVTTVEDYLQSVQDRDLTGACEHVSCAPDAPFLTQEMLDASQDLAPIRDIRIDQDSVSRSGDQIFVMAEYVLGVRTVSTPYSLRKEGSDWTIENGLVTWDTADFTELSAEVNGVPLTSGSVTVFPGEYELSFENPHFELAGGNAPLSLAKQTDSTSTRATKPVLTDAARQQGQALVKQAFADCAAERTLRSSCGVDVTAAMLPGTEDYTGKIKREPTELTRLDLEDYATSARASADDPLRYVVSWTASFTVTIDGGRSPEAKSYSETIHTRFPTVDYRSEEPTVSWDESGESAFPE
ncbi:hypothetical protein JD292_05280 [Leucobacter sp. CSA2]|uniref:DUF4878 domain-containing protein n=1 Tax=Leucobacter edaphi TaxID=2796472 RepID=A0A934QC65_9MICO|nr:hypothetical protein [Leucobacter edaphi]MBK0421483.1 hypothetical protein [Leucobacter edaphi]